MLLACDPPYNVGKDYGRIDDSNNENDYAEFSQLWFRLWAEISERQIVTPGCNNLARWCRYFQPFHIAPWTKSNSMTNGKISRFWCWEPILFFGEKWLRSRSNDIFDYPIGQQKAVANHPCPKPLKMWADIIEYYSDPGDVIADALMGSGTTMVVCEQLGRIAIGMELEPKWVAIAIQRMADMGLTARLI